MSAITVEYEESIVLCTLNKVRCTLRITDPSLNHNFVCRFLEQTLHTQVPDDGEIS